MLSLIVWSIFAMSQSEEVPMVYGPPPPDNPLMGLVPYVESDAVDRFPHSLEFQYFPLSKLMTGPDQLNWTPLETVLETTKSRGCQLVARVFLEYPGKDGIPEFLTKGGLKVTKWKSDDGINRTPDYSDPKLREALRNFIAEFGKRYDADPRLGYLTAGLLGSWGEWHTYPREDLWASKKTQAEVLKAFAAAFQKTPVLLRYPAAKDHYSQAENVSRPFGYHDDSFDWATLDTGNPDDDWYFIPSLKAAGALDKWKTHPIGGEIRPELWKQSFTAKQHPKSQGFLDCVRQTHATWLLDTGLFGLEFPMPPERKKRAIEEVRQMGYTFHVSSWKQLPDRVLEIVVENRGLAPFYQDWPVVVAGFEGEAKRWEKATSASLVRILPGQKKQWKMEFPENAEGLEIRLMVPNPMSGGKPLRFANQTQGEKWLVLGRLDLP